MISLNSVRSASEYLIVGPFCSYIGVSNTDLVNSGSYFTALLIVVLGITTFVGLGGSFFTIGFVAGLMETSDFGSTAPFFLATGLTTGGGAGVAGFTSGLCGTFAATFATGLATGFLAGTIFLDAGLAAIFL